MVNVSFLALPFSMYCIPTWKLAGFPINDGEAKTDVGKSCLASGSNLCKFHFDGPAIEIEFDCEASETTASDIG
jgi:hypothetical protein